MSSGQLSADSRRIGGRTALVALAFVTGIQVSYVEPALIVLLVLMSVLALACLASLSGPARSDTGSVWVARGAVLIGAVVLVDQALARADLSPALAAIPVAVIAMSVCVVLLGRDDRAGWLALWALVAGVALLVTPALLRTTTGIDVQLYIDGAVSDVLAGQSPYGGTTPNTYSAEETLRYFGPQVVDGDQILIGFPYLPSVLLVDLPSHFLPDVRLIHLAALIGAVVLLRRMAVDTTGRVLAVFPLCSPITWDVLSRSFVEPVMVLFVVALTWAMVARSRLAGILSLAAFLASKQYVAALVPSVLPVARRLGLRVVLAGAGLATVLVAVFWALEPRGFWRDVVLTQLRQPYRDDSNSWVVIVQRHVGEVPGWASAVLPLALGLGVSAYVAWRRRDHPAGLPLSAGLGLLATVLVSKQAFANYYFFCCAMLAAAAVVWPLDSTEREATPPRT